MRNVILSVVVLVGMMPILFFSQSIDKLGISLNKDVMGMHKQFEQKSDH
jgi:hypothetical protein